MSAPTQDVMATAYPNIALIKYWGKRSEDWVLPETSSLSMTLDCCPTTTRISLDPTAAEDWIVLNGQTADPTTHRRCHEFLDIVRTWSGRREHAVVESINTGPTGAGLASSAAGFAALAVAASAAYGLKLGERAMSRLARRGSGSACRSVLGGFVQWHAGTGDGDEGDLSSYAETVPVGDMNPAMVLAMTDAEPKPTPSREAMRRTRSSSPLYPAWNAASETDLVRLCEALERGDLAQVGQIAEDNALGMHATMLAARPAIRYLTGASLAVLDEVIALRVGGVSAYATIDAGPNIVVFCPRADAVAVARSVERLDGVCSVRIAGPGPGARLDGEPA